MREICGRKAWTFSGRSVFCVCEPGHEMKGIQHSWRDNGNFERYDVTFLRSGIARR